MDGYSADAALLLPQSIVILLASPSELFYFTYRYFSYFYGLTFHEPLLIGRHGTQDSSYP